MSDDHGGRNQPGSTRGNRRKQDAPAARAERLLHSLDRAQQSRRWLAIVVATVKKFFDNRAGNLAALIAYFAFASLFPLLLVAYTVLDLIARNNAQLASRLTAALHQYPVIGAHLGGTNRGLSKTGFALFVGILLTLYAGRGVARAMQNAMNTVWGVPKFRQPRFPKSLLRDLGLIAVLGPGEIVTIALSTAAGGVGHIGGAGAKVVAFAVSLVLNIALFWLSFRIATSKEVSGRELRLGAVLAALVWQILQLIGGTILSHTTNSAYGVFGVVLGVLVWFYVQAQITLYVVEFDVVRSRRLWPRSLVPPPLTGADLRAYEMYAEASLLRPELRVEVELAPGEAGDGPRAQQ